MRRRAFLLAGATLLPLGGADAQPAARREMPAARVAILSPIDSPSTANLDAFRARLHELGYREGRNLVFDYKLGGGRLDRLVALARELVGAGGVDAIVAESTAAAQAARQATATIPILALAGVDPVGSGLAQTLARPGGNVTGVAILAEEMNAKRLELVRDAFPQARHLATVSTIATATATPANLRALQEAGRALGLTIEILHVQDFGDLGRALSPAALAGYDGFVMVPDVGLTPHRAEIVARLAASRRPVVYVTRAWVEAGGLLSLGPDIADAYRRLAEYLDRVLTGTAPGDLPFERPTKLELVINLRAARALGIEIPSTLLARADEVIE